MRQRNKAITAAVAAAFSSGILAIGHSAMAQTDVWTANNNAGNASGSFKHCRQLERRRGACPQRGSAGGFKPAKPDHHQHGHP